MQRDNLPWQPMPPAQLDWDSSDIPSSRQFDDVYFHRLDGLAESHYVFLQGNNLPERWLEHPGDTFVIGETGFGTGLNFLLTWQAWLKLPEPRPRLHYLSVECFPLRRDELSRALANWPTLATLAQELLTRYPEPVAGTHRLLLERGAITLDLWWADATGAFTDMLGRGLPLVDAWYLDGFTPSRNESLWQQPLLTQIGQLSKPGATLATFTAASTVRQGLQSAGFSISKGPGFDQKRERLLGTLEQTQDIPFPTATPWDLPSTPSPAPTSAIVLGAGLAGSATAAALARRGIEVTVLDAGGIAGAASGNEQGILYTRLSRRHSPLVDFGLLSFAHAATVYTAMFAGEELAEGTDGALCGSFHQHHNEAELTLLKPLLAATPGLAKVLDADQASALLGVRQNAAGYWYPHSGWLSPPAVCRTWLARRGITVQSHCGTLSLVREGALWQARDAHGTLLATADCAIVATGHRSPELPGLEWLPLQAIRGQTTLLPASAPFSQLRAGLCHTGYIAPAQDGWHCIGATFNLNEQSPILRSEDHQTNLQALAQAVPHWSDALARLDPASLDGRVGFRCASPDYLPLVGPVPDMTEFLQRFSGLRRNARRDIASRGAFEPGLYLNTGHGSRGLTSTPLAAELLASQICNEPLPLSRSLTRALAPARFPIRDLRRKRL